jgi:hypothetical protein
VDEQEKRPDAASLRHLVSLRFMLADATRWASQAGPERLTTAVVLLDGVVERALALAATEAGVSVRLNDSGVEIGNRLREKRRDWKPPAWRDIQLLHRARNGAQHDGLRPNAQEIGPWISAVGALVRDVVAEYFGLDLDRVTMSDAIQTRVLREQMERAAEHLVAGRHSRSVTESINAVLRVSGWWARAQRPSDPGSEVLSDSRASRFQMTDLERRALLGTFAQDPAEVAWFVRTMNDRPAAMDADDAERALAFATAWILGYEAAMVDWVSDRTLRAQRHARLERTGDGPAYIVSSNVTQLAGKLYTRVHLADVPGPDDFDAWSITVEGVLGGLEGPGLRIRGDGTVELRGADVADLSAQIRTLDSALKQADERLAQDRAADVRLQQRQRDEAERYAAAIEEFGGLPAWLQSVAPSADLVGLSLTLAVGMEWLNAAGTEMVVSLFAERGEVDRARRVGRRDLTITPALAPDQLIAVLADLDVTVQALIRSEVKRAAEKRRVADSANRELRTLLGDLDPRARS